MKIIDILNKVRHPKREETSEGIYDAHVNLRDSQKIMLTTKERVATTVLYKFGVRNPETLMMDIENARLISKQESDTELSLENAIDFISAMTANGNLGDAYTVFDGSRVFCFNRSDGDQVISVEENLEPGRTSMAILNINQVGGGWVVVKANRVVGSCDNLRQPESHSRFPLGKKETESTLENVRMLVGRLRNLHNK